MQWASNWRLATGDLRLATVMLNLIRAEWFKLVRRPMAWVLLIVLLALLALVQLGEFIVVALHDGPAQEISLALLRLDPILACCEGDRAATSNGPPDSEHVAVIESSLNNALQELRAISCGLGLPQLGDLTLAETIARVVRAHERRT